MQWLDAHNYSETWIGEHHSGGYEIYGQTSPSRLGTAERSDRLGLEVVIVDPHFHDRS